MNTVMPMLDFTMREARKILPDIMKAGLVPMITSSPGVGKSSMVRDIIDEYNLHLIDHRVSTSAPEDMTGLPKFIENRATFVPFDLFPLEDTPIPEGKEGFALFLDEFNSADKSVQAAAYKLILDRMVGQYRLHPNTVIFTAGNHMTDGAIVNKLSTAMLSRLVHMHVRPDAQEWVEDVAVPQKYDERVIAYISYKKDNIMVFNPDIDDQSFPCPRTWEFVSEYLKVVNKIEPYHTKVFSGMIGTGTAVDFAQFVKVFEDLPHISQIVADPENFNVPRGADVCWATSLHLLSNVDESTMEAVFKYINRFSAEFKIMFYRSITARIPEVRQSNTYHAAIVDLSQYLNN